MGKPGEGTMAFVTSRADALWPEGRVPDVISADFMTSSQTKS